MENNKILARIASDVADAGNGMFGVRDITIGMTIDLFRTISPEHYLLLGHDGMCTLFGCKVKVFPCSGLWWLVGYEGTAMEGELVKKKEGET